ncbi:MAG: transcription-repair coupling factor, partial [Cyanobacteria bacterium J06641_2]
MAISSIVRALGRSPLTTELLSKLKTLSTLQLNGIPRLPKGLVASALANSSERNLFVVCATLEEAGRWTTQLETMGWKTIHFYPTSEASPYEPFDPETEMTWGQMQVLADLIKLSPDSGNQKDIAVIATQAALQPHLPPPEAFKPFCLNIAKGMEFNLGTFAKKMAALGYERVPLVEMEGTWSRRGDIVDVFPVSSELPVRLDWFGDEIEQIREFDPATQRSALDKIDQIILTPTSFAPILMADEDFKSSVENYLSPEEKEQLDSGQLLEGTRRFLGLAYEKPASLLDYLPKNTLVAVDESEQCVAHSLLWVENAEEQWEGRAGGAGGAGGAGEAGEEGGDDNSQLPKIHRFWEECLEDLTRFESLYLSE